MAVACYMAVMGRRRPRTDPTATELARVEKILIDQPAFRAHLGPKVPAKKRTREVVSFHVGTFAVAEAMIAGKLNPERAHVRVVLRTAVVVFGITRRAKPVSEPARINRVDVACHSIGPG